MDMSSASADGMASWKPYLHTSLFSSFSELDEPFLFPTFRIRSLATFLAAALFTFILALAERFLTYTSSHKTTIWLGAIVYFAATLLRYMLMIVAMGMDWFLLLSAVSGLTIGNALTEMHKSPRKRRVHEEHVELLNQEESEGHKHDD